MTTVLIYIAGAILLLLLIAGLFAWQWRRLDAPMLPVSEQWAVQEPEVKQELAKAKNLPVKTRGKTVNTVYYQQPKYGKKGQHKKKKSRKRQPQEEMVKGAV